MTEVKIPELLAHFADLPDPRKARGIRHELSDIIVISILAVICGANSYSHIRQYGLANHDWLKTFLALPSGIPSQDTFERIFALLNPEAWQARFLEWARALVLPDLPEGEDEITAVDGKTARGSAHASSAALHTVSVWSSQFELVVGQEHVPDKSNEIAVIPGLLEVVAPALARAKPDPSGSSAARW